MPLYPRENKPDFQRYWVTTRGLAGQRIARHGVARGRTVESGRGEKGNPRRKPPCRPCDDRDSSGKIHAACSSTLRLRCPQSLHRTRRKACAGMPQRRYASNSSSTKADSWPPPDSRSARNLAQCFCIVLQSRVVSGQWRSYAPARAGVKACCWLRGEHQQEYLKGVAPRGHRGGKVLESEPFPFFRTLCALLCLCALS